MTSVTLTLINLSVIRQKGESQNGGDKNTKHAKFSPKRIFSTPLCVSGGKKILVLLKILHTLFSCNNPFEICPFAIFTDEMIFLVDYQCWAFLGYIRRSGNSGIDESTAYKNQLLRRT